MKENLYAYSFCHDKDYIWIIDFLIRGLFRINKKNFFIECMLSPMEIYKKKVFNIQKLLIWNNSILLIPQKLNERWTIFYKELKTVEQFCPIDKTYYCADAVLRENRVICIPLKVSEPIIVVDLREQKCINIIKLCVSKTEIHNLPGEIWSSIADNNKIYFPILESSFIGVTDGVNVNFIKLTLDIPVAAADLYKGKWWVITTGGKEIYCFDFKGNLLGKFLLNRQCNCVRLIATHRFIFLLPERGKALNVFDIKYEKIREINMTVKELQEPFHNVSYWHYYCFDRKIVFLPHNFLCTVVDLDTLSVENKEMSFTEKFVRQYYWNFYREVRIFSGKKIFDEDINTSLRGYLKSIIKQNEKKENYMICGNGKIIWGKISKERIG